MGQPLLDHGSPLTDRPQRHPQPRSSEQVAARHRQREGPRAHRDGHQTGGSARWRRMDDEGLPGEMGQRQHDLVGADQRGAGREGQQRPDQQDADCDRLGKGPHQDPGGARRGGQARGRGRTDHEGLPPADRLPVHDRLGAHAGRAQRDDQRRSDEPDDRRDCVGRGPRADQGDRRRGRPPQRGGTDHRGLHAQVGQSVRAEHVAQADRAQCGGQPGHLQQVADRVGDGEGPRADQAGDRPGGHARRRRADDEGLPGEMGQREHRLVGADQRGAGREGQQRPDQQDAHRHRLGR